MYIALFIGNHSKDGFRARVGRWAIRTAQKGQFKDVTHVEAILNVFPLHGVVVMGSSSLMDGGLRTKTARLTPENWRIVDVPAWSVERSREYFVERTAPDGSPIYGYDTRGALATVLPGGVGSSDRKFCNQAVGESVGVADAHTLTPATFAVCAMAAGGRDVTEDFFKQMGKAP